VKSTGSKKAGCDVNTCLVGFTGDVYACDVKDQNCPILRNLHIRRIESAGIYKRFHNCTFESIEKREVPARIRTQYAEVKSFADNLKENLDEGRGLLLKGSVGTMKTTLAVAVLQKHIADGGAGLFITMPSLLDNIFTLKAKSQEEWANYEQKIRETPLLILDDMGSEHTEGWVLTKVDAIISERYNRCRSIIITTNLSTEQLKDTYAERVIDRLRSTLLVINFAGQSFRQPA